MFKKNGSLGELGGAIRREVGREYFERGGERRKSGVKLLIRIRMQNLNWGQKPNGRGGGYL